MNEFDRTPAPRTFIRDHALGPFNTVVSADGSLTACFGDGETMHSLRGAFNETVYIYGTALDHARAQLSDRAAQSSIGNDSRSQSSVSPGTLSPRTLSLGLGLGYVEILASAYAVKAGQTPYGESFESVDDLTESFRAWLRGENEILVPHALYNDVAKRAEAITGISPEKIRETLATAVEHRDWLLRPAMTLATEFTHKFHCVAFDAFSSKSTPELWSRDFLDSFLNTACDTPCVLSTYACTGHLKRALKDAGFTLEIREGYASKRDSTLATRLK